MIENNSFYDVNQKKYSKEELTLYKELTGIPLVESYEQLMEYLESNYEERDKKRPH